MHDGYIDFLADVVLSHMDAKVAGRTPCKAERGWVGVRKYKSNGEWKGGCKRAKAGTASRVRGVQRLRKGKERLPAKATPKEEKARLTKGNDGKFTVPSKVRPDQVPGVIREIEDSLQLQREYESVVAYGPDGTLKAFKDGGKASVGLSKKEAYSFKDGIITHNHPGGWKFPPDDPQSKGNSFSPEDIYLAISVDAAEVRAVTPGYRFSMKRPEGGWKVSGKQTKALLQKMEAYEVRQGKARIKSAADRKMQVSEENSQFWHNVMTMFAKKTGSIYTREEYKPVNLDSDATGQQKPDPPIDTSKIKKKDIDTATGEVKGTDLIILDHDFEKPVYSLDDF